MNKTDKEHEVGDALAEALRRLRYEVIPIGGVEEAIVEHVPKSIKLTVTASPKKGIEETLRLAERLSGRGYKVAPHISARLVHDEAHLEDILGRLRGAGIKDVFVIAGDADEPAGKFEGADALLGTMAEIGHTLEEVGISGYPESHPLISDETTIQAMYDKAPYATYIVSQICFDPAVTAHWIRRVRNRGVGMPIYIGIPGVVSTTKLMRISGSIGLGESARFLKKYGNRFFRILLPGRYRPDRLIEDLTPSLIDPQCKVKGFHMYTFNEMDKTEAWRREKLESIGAAKTA
ncbi:MAG: methylenetetrahydrofolate reductase [Actinomycetota bacterium]|jgi:methylenetetrahydrofolate reductase (NADPH)|nr:methylenetetrahydrofolate reductase [Actinomycetota bacterium]